jgi:hypothetical protein
MRLNNKGWGTKELIISAAIIFLLLLIISYYVHRLYEVMDFEESKANDTYYVESSNTQASKNKTKEENIQSNYSEINNIDYSYYKDYENKMTSAAISYMHDYDKFLDEDYLLVNMIDLVDLNYISLLHDKYDDSICEGYVTIKDSNGAYDASSFIKCSNYTTEGY